MKTELDYIKTQIIGSDFFIETPFGKRLLLYLDYTASGRGLLFIENYLLELQKEYANTHTEDDETGWITTNRIYKAEEIIKKAVNAGPDYHVIFTGSGTTGCIQKLMEILGLYFPPGFKKIFNDIEKCAKKCNIKKPVVFVGPYEHHSNLVSWREGFCEVIPIRLDENGELSVEDYVKKLQDPRWKDRMTISSFSAASNVTGIKTDVYKIAEIAHENNSLIFFDFAACAPYVPIDINRDKHSYFDCIFFSPHKCLGGPGSSGVLIFHDKIYDRNLPPTFGGGGTVSYVNEFSHDYLLSVEEREKPGTPGILQIFKAALAMEVKDYIGIDYIREREEENIKYVFDRWKDHPLIEILGPKDPERVIGILSYNIKHKDRHLHGKYISRILNDLFGIQSRAGCSCAGPYGHYLLNIDLKTSTMYRQLIQKGYNGLKPGWARINLHYTLDREELDFLIKAIEFIAEYGHRFLSLYEFNLISGDWHYKGFKRPVPVFSIEDAIKTDKQMVINKLDRKKLYDEYLSEANKIAGTLSDDIKFIKLDEELEKACYFYIVNLSEK
jgi:selenocysteine lyase/cysteine desulfurase